MTTLLKYLISTKSIVGTGFFTVLAMTILFSTPQAHANQYPNILTGPNMTVGSRGDGVVVLQGLMSELGYLNVPQGTPLGYYGSLTEDAVARYQSSMSVSPAAGYYGPTTKVSMHQNFSNHGWLTLLGW